MDADAAAGPLTGLTVVELSAFVAAPLAGATLAALGATVIRIEQEGGGIDARRWPLAADGHSLYREGLDRGKRLLQIDLREEPGRQRAIDLIAAADALVTNLPTVGWTAFENLNRNHPRLVMVVITGTPDGAPAVDYTVNAGTGFPYITGPVGTPDPVNHVLPAWDVAAALTATTGLLAALRDRDRTGRGALVEIALSDVALTTADRLGYLAEARETEDARPRIGNAIFGTYGTALQTADGRHLMVCALTPRQWRGLLRATGLEARFPEPELEADEAERYRRSEEIDAALAGWAIRLTLAQAGERLEAANALWGPYRSFKQLLAEDPRAMDPPASAIRIRH